MVIDPWGIVVAQAPDQVGIVRAELDTARVASIRRQIPVLANSRPATHDVAARR
jgi:predicted amidohydrolase